MEVSGELHMSDALPPGKELRLLSYLGPPYSEGDEWTDSRPDPGRFSFSLFIFVPVRV